MPKAKKAAPHPLDIPAFLVAKGRSPRDEAEIQRICARANAVRQPIDEKHDPRLLEAMKRGVISRSVLRDPSSIAIALATIAPKSVERIEKSVADAAERPERVARPVDHVTAIELASTLDIDAKLLRQALRALKIDKPAYGWAFSKSDIPALTKRIKAWLKEKKS